jgi:LL-diaminopimelate aminotransferase
MIYKTADRLAQVEEYYFSKKLAYIQEMRNRGTDVINLGIGSPDLMPPPEVLAAARDAVQDPTSHGYASYRSTPELRQAMSAWYQRNYKVQLDPAQEILPLLGSKEGILYLSMALLNPGDTVLVPNPGYPAYASVAHLLGARVLYYDLNEQNGWLPNLNEIEKEDLSRCKLMWVNYPHMPTGTATTLPFFKTLVDFAKRKKIFICNDNPYGLILNQEDPMSILSADPTFEISGELNSLSKSFNMAGWRVGVFMGSKEIVNAVLQIKSNVDSGMFLGTQKGAIAALGVPNHWHKARNQIYQERRARIYKIFDALGFTYALDQVGLFVWAKAPNSILSVPNFVDRVLDEAHVFLTPGFIFGSNGDRFARASLCASVERLDQAIERIEKWKQGLAP